MALYIIKDGAFFQYFKNFFNFRIFCENKHEDFPPFNHPLPPPLTPPLPSPLPSTSCRMQPHNSKIMCGLSKDDINMYLINNLIRWLIVKVKLNPPQKGEKTSSV